MKPSERAMLFWTVCIPSRLVMAALVPRYVSLCVTLWWAVFEDSEVGFFGGVAWWAPLRRWHAAHYAWHALTGDRRALVLDSVLAVVAGLTKMPC